MEDLEAMFAAEAEEVATARGLELTPPELRDVPFRGAILRVPVPYLCVPDGPPEPPPRLAGFLSDPNGIRTLREAGVSGPDIERVVTALHRRPAVRGSSPSSVSRLDVETGEEDYEWVMARRFDGGHDPIVVASIDGTAIGNTGAKETVMIVIGITASGKRLVLGSCIANHERAEDIVPLLKSILGRGVDRNIVWVADRGEGIAKALRAVGAANVQVCTKHLARNVTKDLPEDLQKTIRLLLYEAWAEDDRDLALGKLSLVSDRLQSLGYLKQAGSLVEGMHGSVTLQRLHVPFQARGQLDSTNPLEAVNSSLKRRLRAIPHWRSGPGSGDEKQPSQVEMRLRFAAKRLRRLEEFSWRRLGQARALVELGKGVLPSSYNAEAILARLPPSLVVTRQPAAHDERFGLSHFAEQWCKKAPDATWIGSPHALAVVGLAPGAAVDQRALLLAMEGRHADTEATLREPSEVPVIRYDADGYPQSELATGVLCLRWELTASPSLTAAWNQAEPSGRGELEQTFRQAAFAAVESVTATTHRGQGFASTAALETAAGPDGEPELRIRGIAVGVVRGRNSTTVLTPAAQAAFRSASARDAEDAAQEVLAGALERHRPAEPAREPPSAALLRGVEARAIERAAATVGADPKELAAAAADRDEAFAALELVAGEGQTWIDSRWKEAVQDIAIARLQAAASGAEIGDFRLALRRGDRLVLGEEKAQELLGEAAELYGRAEVDPSFAAELMAAESDALTALRPAVERVERAAASIGAQYELDRQKLFREALETARSEAVTVTEVSTSDSTGRRILAPIGRYANALGPRRGPLERYAGAVSEQLKKSRSGDAVLQVLANELGDPWHQPRLGDPQRRPQFMPIDAMRIGSLERDREALLSEYLRGRRLLGQQGNHAAVGSQQEKSQWQELRAIEARLGEMLDVPGNADEFCRRHPEAAVQSAVQAERLDRGRALEQAKGGPERTAPTGLETPGNGLER